MKKVTYTMAFVLSSLIFSGCAEKQTSIPKTLDEVKSCTDTLFDKNPWIVNPTVENGISAVGISHLSKGGMEFTIPQAEMDAKAKLAGQIQTEVSRLSKKALREAKIVDMDNFEKVFTQATKELIKKIPLSGAKRINMKVGCGELYVHMAIEKRDIAEQLKDMQNLHKSYMEKAKLERAMIDEGEKVLDKMIDELNEETKN